jgi:hypothetical protein
LEKIFTPEQLEKLKNLRTRIQRRGIMRQGRFFPGQRGFMGRGRFMGPGMNMYPFWGRHMGRGFPGFRDRDWRW